MNTKRQTAWSVSTFKGIRKSETKQLKFCLCFSVKLICRLQKKKHRRFRRSGFLKRKLLKKKLKKLNETIVKLLFYFSLQSRMAAIEISV